MVKLLLDTNDAHYSMISSLTADICSFRINGTDFTTKISHHTICYHNTMSFNMARLDCSKILKGSCRQTKLGINLLLSCCRFQYSIALYQNGTYFVNILVLYFTLGTETNPIVLFVIRRPFMNSNQPTLTL